MIVMPVINMLEWKDQEEIQVVVNQLLLLICTVNGDKTFWLNLIIWGRFYDVIYGWQADFQNVTRGA
jgi:hypothetical protein